MVKGPVADFKEGALCPACEVGRLVRKVKDMPFKYVTIHGQPSFHCSVCKESFCNKDVRAKLEKILNVVRDELF